MKTIKFKNRKNLSVSFTPHPNGFIVRCPDSRFGRWGTGTDGKPSFYDPEGGPFIHVGDNLSRFHSDLPDDPILSLEWTENGILLKTK